MLVIKEVVMLNLVFVLGIPIVVVIFILFIVIGVLQTTQQRRDQMIKTTFNYVILFITLMLVLGGSIGIFISIADIVVPTNKNIQTFEEYRLYNTTKYINDKEVTLSEQELRKMFDENREFNIQQVLLEGKRNLIRSVGFVLVPLPIFLYYQRLVRRHQTQE
jgi:hypothetical protein